MNEICVPIPRFAAEKSAEVVIKIADDTKRFNYRVEAFEWFPEEQLVASQASTKGEERIHNLKGHIESYDKQWELIQIYNPGPRDKFIQVLFRQRVN